MRETIHIHAASPSRRRACKSLRRAEKSVFLGQILNMPVIERVVRPRRNRVSVEVPRKYNAYSCRVIIVPLQEEAKKPKYDFSDVFGKLQWKGDAVAEQRRLCDEW